MVAWGDVQRAERGVQSYHCLTGDCLIAPVSLQSRTYSVSFGTWKVRRLTHENDYEYEIRELTNHDEVHDDEVCWLGKDWNENVGFGGKKET